MGGIAELPDVTGAPLETEDSSGLSAGLLAGIIAGVTAGALALGGAAWYARGGVAPKQRAPNPAERGRAKR